jgi:hypothetical protein
MRLVDAAGRLGSLGLITYVVLLRLPYIGLGFGSDWDAWLLAVSGRRLVAGEGYAPSRPPGYPASEALFGSVERFGPIATNLVAVLASVLVALALARILEVAGRKRALLLSACALSLPIAIVAGSSTMDYLPSLAAFLWALVAAEQRHAFSSAVLLALSVAARPATLALTPVWFFLVAARSGAKRTAGATLLALLGIALAAVPPALALGPSHMGPEVGDYPSRYMVARRVWDETFGPVGLAALLCGACVIPFVRRAPDDAIRRVRMCLLWIGILGCAVYLWIPYEAGYLLAPAIAGIAWVGIQVPPRLLLVLAGAFLLSPHIDPIDGSTALERDADFRRRVAQAAAALPAAATEIPLPATVVTGFLTPQWLYAVGNTDSLRGITWISAESLADLRGRGVRVYYVPTIAAWHRRIHRVDLAEFGAIPLPTTEEILLRGLDFQN